MRKILSLASFGASLVLVAAVASAENWAQWRGPAFNGSTTETNLPADLNGKERWATELAGHGCGTPVVFGDRIFAGSLDRKSKELVGQCLDRATGKVLWTRVVGMGYKQNNLNDLASASPITDGKTVWFYFGSGDLAAFDFDGKKLWSRSIEKDHGAFNMQWLYASSPLLYKDRLYIPVLHRDVDARNWKGPASGDKLAPSYLLAVDPATGKDIWKHIRPNEAKVESKESYATLVPYEGKGRSELLIIGGDCVSGHDPETGKEYWRAGGWNPKFENHWRIVPSVLVAGDLFIACAPKKGPVIAMRPGGNGDVTATHIAWQNAQITTDAATPLFYKGNLYVLDGDWKKGVSCLDPATGQVKWFTPIISKRPIRTSPTGADGKIYVMNEPGDVWVLSADNGKILSTIQLGSEGLARGSVVAAQGMVFIRTGGKLHAFAN